MIEVGDCDGPGGAHSRGMGNGGLERAIAFPQEHVVLAVSKSAVRSARGDQVDLPILVQVAGRQVPHRGNRQRRDRKHEPTVIQEDIDPLDRAGRDVGPPVVIEVADDDRERVAGAGQRRPRAEREVAAARVDVDVEPVDDGEVEMTVAVEICRDRAR